MSPIASQTDRQTKRVRSTVLQNSFWLLHLPMNIVLITVVACMYSCFKNVSLMLAKHVYADLLKILIKHTFLT